MDESKRVRKLNKFGGTKYVYPLAMIRDLRGYFEAELSRRFPSARILY